MDTKHLKPHQISAKDRYVDRKTQLPVSNMIFKDVAPFISIIGEGAGEVYKGIVGTYCKGRVMSLGGNMVTISSSKGKITYYCDSVNDTKSKGNDIKGKENDAKSKWNDTKNKGNENDPVNKLYTYIDLAKVSDLVILTVNSSLTTDLFEVTSLLKAHGMCKVLTICLNTDNKAMKFIKKRVWKEIANGIKVFNVRTNAEYSSIARSINQMKFRPLQFRCNNSYVVVDKIRSITNNELCRSPIDDKLYELYGYVRGCQFTENSIHIPGVGDFNIVSKEVLQDPCGINKCKLLDKEKRVFYMPKFYNTDNANNTEEEENNIKEGENKEDEANYFEEENYIKDDVSEEVESDDTIEGESSNKEDEFKLLGNIGFLQEKENIEFTCETSVNSLITDTHNVEATKNIIETNNFKCDLAVTKCKDLLTKSENINDIITEEESMVKLLESLKRKFRSKNESEADHIIKFDSKYKEDLPTASLRDSRLLQEEKNLKTTRNYIPGQYIKIIIASRNSIKFNNLTICGSIAFNKNIQLQGRVKKTNYYQYTLKSNVEYLVSIGWRRDVVSVIFSLKDPTRNKFLKYMLDNMHCNANFTTKMVQPGTPFSIIKHQANYSKGFRIAAHGTITETSGVSNIYKKLKLIGYPKKIMENTVFVGEMFSSDKEVAKFEGAMLKSVGKLRGSVKKAVGADGTFRATFEGRMLMSDIIFMRCYVPYEFFYLEKKLIANKDKENIIKSRPSKEEVNHYDSNAEGTMLNYESRLKDSLNIERYNEKGHNYKNICEEDQSEVIRRSSTACTDSNSAKINEIPVNHKDNNFNIPSIMKFPFDDNCELKAKKPKDNKIFAKTLSESVENRKKRRFERDLVSLKSRLTLDKQEIIEEKNDYDFDIPDNKLSGLTKLINEERTKYEVGENMKLSEVLKKSLKEKGVIEVEKKKRLIKNILESKEKKKHKPKRKK